jgi:hypothetical protein
LRRFPVWFCFFRCENNRKTAWYCHWTHQACTPVRFWCLKGLLPNFNRFAHIALNCGITILTHDHKSKVDQADFAFPWVFLYADSIIQEREERWSELGWFVKSRSRYQAPNAKQVAHMQRGSTRR